MALALLPTHGFMAFSLIPDSLNPFQYMADGVASLIDHFMLLLQRSGERPLIDSNAPFLLKQYGGAVGLASDFGKYMLISVVLLAIIFHSLIRQALGAAVAIFMFAALGVASFALWEMLLRARLEFIRNTLHEQSKLYTQTPNQLAHGDVFAWIRLVFGPIGHFWTILLGGAVAFYALYLMVMYYVEAIAIIVVKFLFPIAIVYWPYGERGQKLLSWTLAAGLVSTFIGPILATIILEFTFLFAGRVIDEHHPIIGLLIMLVGMRYAARTQRTMYTKLLRALQVRIGGLVKSMSQVRGNVTSAIQKMLDVKVRNRASVISANSTPFPASNRDLDNGRQTKHSRVREIGGLALAIGGGAIGAEFERRAQAKRSEDGTHRANMHDFGARAATELALRGRAQRVGGKR